MGQSNSQSGFAVVEAEKEATPDIQYLVDMVKKDVMYKLKDSPLDLSELRAVSFRTQTTAGTNYYVKAESRDGKLLHLRIYESLPCELGTPFLRDLQLNKNANDPIEFF